MIMKSLQTVGVLAIAISFPAICRSFQLKALSAPAVLNPHSTKAKTPTHLESRKESRHFHGDSCDDRIHFLNFDRKRFNSEENKYNAPVSLSDRISRCALNFAAASILFFSIGTTAIGPVLPAFADSSTETPQQQSLLLKDPSPEELAIRGNQQQSGKMSSSIIDEVWTLLDKYYIDRTFNSQDWKEVRTKVEAQGEKVQFDNDKSMKIVTEMVQSLGDKYTRMLDKEQYTAIQKFDLIGVGVTLVPNAQKDIIIGAPPIAGSASDKAGLKIGDFVTAVNGRPTRGRNAFDIIDQIGENPNAKTVTFSILRDKGPSTLDSIGNPDASEAFEVTMDRQTMEVKDPVQYKISETRSDGTSTFCLHVP